MAAHHHLTQQVAEVPALRERVEELERRAGRDSGINSASSAVREKPKTRSHG